MNDVRMLYRKSGTVAQIDPELPVRQSEVHRLVSE
jgi:hypothetical protein